jgi:RND family efflux transporter MFP subunit
MDAVVDNLGLPPATADSYRSSISLARNNINAAISSLTTLQQNISTQKVLLQRSKDALALKEAGSAPEAIAAQEAVVRQVQATASSIAAQLSKMTLFSPISGLVTRQDAKRGQVVGVNTVVVSVISDANMEIESNVPEVDIGKIALGNPVDITLDAFPGETMTGKIASINPAETIVDGVVSYKIKVAFDKPDSRIKSGLTANLTIRTLEKPNVLLVPSYAILEHDGKTFVKVMSGASQQETEVKLGIRGKDGNVEVISGVSENQQVVNIGLKTQ